MMKIGKNKWYERWDYWVEVSNGPKHGKFISANRVNTTHALWDNSSDKPEKKKKNLNKPIYNNCNIKKDFANYCI